MWDLHPQSGEEKLMVPDVPEAYRYTQKAPNLEARITLSASEGIYAPSRAVRFNPRYCMLGVGGEELVSNLVVAG